MEEQQDRPVTRNERTTDEKAYSTSSLSPVDLCAFPPPFFDLFPSKASWITPTIHMPMPVWDDNLLDTFDLTLDDVERAIRQRRQTVTKTTSNNDNPPKSPITHADRNDLNTSTLSTTPESSHNNSNTAASSSSDSDVITLANLIKLACDNPLNSQQLLQLNSIIDRLSNNAIGQSIQLDTREWHKLMEFNARTAIALLKVVLSESTDNNHNSNNVDTSSVEAATLRLIYLDILASAPFTLRTAEIILELARQHRLDSDFTASYLSGCMDACNRQTNHESAQRTARLICILLRSLIQDQFFDLNSSELMHFRVEWQSFCLQYSKEKEAAAMYQLLTTNET
ncbi:hypothetical protein BDF22DRAFT_670576 [Syncephalis plumigaleata]|nr:hypothetical protein BDF22DRAFT_670576 [Syncephalis plumigaleata]